MQLTPEEIERIIERGVLARVTAQRQAKSARLKHVAWACLGCFGLLVVIGLAAFFLSGVYPLGQTSAGATATPYPTYTLYPTLTLSDALEHTATPYPTHPPLPTHTPHPTSKPTVGFTAAERAYLLKVLSITEPCSDALQALSVLASRAGNDPMLILDDEWLLSTAMALAAIKVSNDELRRLEPPTRFSSVHKNLEEAAEHFDRVVYLFAEGVDELDASRIRLAGQEMRLGGAAVERAKTQLEAFTR